MRTPSNQSQPDSALPVACAGAPGSWRRAGRRPTLALCMALSLMPSLAWAGSLTLPPDLVYTVNSASIPRDRAVGQSLLQTGNQGTIVNPSSDPTTCELSKVSTVNGTLVPGYTDVYRTSLPGIGIRFEYTGGTNLGYRTAPRTEAVTFSSPGTYQLFRRAEIVITGPVTGGTLSSLPSMTLTYSGPCLTPARTTTMTLAANSVVTALTCSVTTPNIAVTLPPVPSINLRPSGTTAGDTNFAIGLNCANGGSSSVHVTLTDLADNSNRTSRLTLNSASTAKGVALEILRNGSLVSFGPDSAVAGTQNQLTIGSASGLTSIPMSVRYVSTGLVVPGTVRAAATFTMSYQ